MDNGMLRSGRCFGCMEKSGERFCSVCGFDSSAPQEGGFLPYGTMLSGRYMTGKLLDADGDGASYMGFDVSLNEKVIIREFFPRDLAGRGEDGTQVQILEGCDMPYVTALSAFKRLWRDLARMKHLSCLLPVYDIFEENRTVYAVSEYCNFIPLNQYLLNRPGGVMHWEELRGLLMPVLSTLDALHGSGVIHGGISPETLILCEDKKVRLYGFSIGDVRTERGDLHAQLFSGYTAIEQYGFDSRLAPCTDIYGFAAVIYRAITGNTPPDARARVTNDRLIVPARIAQATPAYVLNALGNAMQVMPAERTQNVEQFRAEISAAPSVTMSKGLPDLQTEVAPVPREEREKIVPPAPEREVKAVKKLGTMWLSLGITLAVLGIIGAVVLIVFLAKAPAELPEEETTQGTTAEEMLVVPNLISHDFLEIQYDKKLNEQFVIEAVEEYNDLDEGIIFDQEPSAGTQAEAGDKIYIKVSKGIEKIVLPSVTSEIQQDAVKMLEDLGFICEVIEKYNSGQNSAGYVAGTDLPAEKEYPKGTKVVVFVWGEAPRAQTAPPEEQ